MGFAISKIRVFAGMIIVEDLLEMVTFYCWFHASVAPWKLCKKCNCSYLGIISMEIQINCLLKSLNLINQSSPILLLR